MKTQDFDFYLPPQLIAQHPAQERTASRMLCLDGNSGNMADKMFLDFPAACNEGDLLIFNDTRVIKARLFGKKHSGGNVEVLIERVINPQVAYAHVRASRSPKIGSRMRLRAGAGAQRSCHTAPGGRAAAARWWHSARV